jgi:DNA-binding transcriptional LysR family regulator
LLTAVMAGKAAQTSREMRDDVRSGALRQVLPGWIAGDSTLTALMPYRHGLLPSVRAFVEHLAAELPKAVRI